MDQANKTDTLLPSSAQDPALAGLSLALFSAFPHPPTPTRASSEIAGNEKNLLFNNGRSTLIEYKSILKLLKKWKTTFMEDTSDEDNLSGRRPPWKISGK